MDGGPPTAKDEEAFQRDLELAKKDAADKDSSEGEIRFMVAMDSLELVEETLDEMVYRFDPAADDEEDAELYKHVDATLRIIKSGPNPYLESVSLVGREPFSPAFGIKVHEFATVLSFAPVGTAGAVLPSRIEIRMRGRAMLVKKIHKVVEVRYADYRYVGESR